MPPVFVCGPLGHPPLLAAVLGRDPQGRAARLRDHALAGLADGAAAALVARAGDRVAGLVLDDLTDEDAARIAFHAAVFGGLPCPVTVTDDDGAGLAATAHVRPDDPGGGAWDPALWTGRWALAAIATAPDVLAERGSLPPAAVGRRYPNMLVRGASRVRAAPGGPVTLRRRAGPGDVRVTARTTTFAGYFAVESYDLAHRRFDGSESPVIRREAFVVGDAVTVLPYDPVRDRVLLIEQFRTAALARGDSQPWILEPIAGRIDPDETPEDAARREAVEEAGLALGPLLPVAQYYPTTGAVTEYIHSFVALTDLPDGSAGVFGLACEAEDIRGHLVPFAQLMALVATGEVNAAPLILTALWLDRARPGLRGAG